MKTTPTRLLILAASALLFLLPRTAGAADPCKLLTVDEVAKVLGNSVSPAPIGSMGCMWGSGVQRVILSLSDASNWPSITAPGGPGVTKTDVSGIGDAASFGGGFGTFTLSVKQGNDVIILVVIGAKTPDQQKASELALAKLALKRL